MKPDDSVFENVKPKPLIKLDVLSTTIERAGELTDQELLYIEADTRLTSDIEHEGQLRKRVAEYIHVRSLRSMPTSLADVNRLFHRQCTKYETPCAEIVQSLIASGHLIRLEGGGRSVLYSNSVWEAQVGALGKECGELLPRLIQNYKNSN